jgi:hypothetical protein
MVDLPKDWFVLFVQKLSIVHILSLWSLIHAILAEPEE